MNSRQFLVALSVLMSGVFAWSLAQPVHAGEGCVGDCYVQDKPPVVYRNFKRRIQVEQGVYEIAREPSLYGWTRRKVILDQDTQWHETPAVYKTIRVTERTPTRYVWEKRLVHGREVMCKVRVPGERVVTEKQVLVSPGRRIATSQPVYSYVDRRVLLRPYKNIAIYHRAQHVYTTERAAVQPEGYVWRKMRHSDAPWD